MKRNIRGNKQKYVEDMKNSVEKSVGKGSMRQLSETTRKLAGRRSRSQQSVRTCFSIITN